MKRFIVLFTLILTMGILFSGCLSKPADPSLELKSSYVTITDDRNFASAIIITGYDNEQHEIVPTTLYYEFIIKNVGKEEIGYMNNKGTKTLKIKIIPKSNLIATTK